MQERLARLEATAKALRSDIQSLQQRVDALEATRPAIAVADAGVPAGASARAWPIALSTGLAGRDPYDPIVVLSLIGRLFLVLAGGFFLRAMTDAGLLAPVLGISLAFAYGLLWLFLADRAGRLGQRFSAVFHVLAATMVAFPLLVEATTRFKVLSGATSALGIAVLTLGMLLVAWRQRLQAVAWITFIAALPTSLVLLLKTGVVVPFAVYLIAFGIAALCMGYVVGWTALRWPVALTADLVVAGVTLRAMAPQHRDMLNTALLLQGSLLGAYLAVIAIRTLVRGHRVTAFDVIQTAVALLVGFGGAVLLTRANGAVPATIGFVCLVLGAACYGVAFLNLDRREDRERNRRFYTTLALVLVTAGLALVLRGQWLGMVFAVLGVAAAAAWSRTGRRFMLLHGSAYIVAAGIASGALMYGAWALAASPAGPWVGPDAATLIVAVAGASCAALAAVQPGPDGDFIARALRLVIALLVVVIASGSAVGYLAPLVAGLDDGGVDLGALATARTGVLVFATLAVAWIGRHRRFREWAWLVYPLLVGTGLKMVVQDFGNSRPATLFVALAVYGAALIVAPRLRKSDARLRKSPTSHGQDKN